MWISPARSKLVERYRALIGELGWHSVTVDGTIESMSQSHYDSVLEAVRAFWGGKSFEGLRILEVGCYAHTTGYKLLRELDADVTLFDISAKALALGRRLAGDHAPGRVPRLVAGDFHRLPFEAESFDLVFIASSIHHTWNWKRVVCELLDVLARGGLLVVENEPCRREACLYKFRVNRPESYTPFEKTLDSLGLIQTFAEPYPGSRPETLFGMIENQQIPLDALLAAVRQRADVLRLKLQPMIGELEKGWLALRSESLGRIETGIRESLMERWTKAQASLGENVDGGLPTPAEINRLATNVARLLRDLPSPEHPEYDCRLSTTFGSPVHMVARKVEGAGILRRMRTLFQRQPIRHNGIEYSFSRRLSSLLIYENSRIPDLQSASTDDLHSVFPREQWRVENGSNGIRSVVLGSSRGEVLMPRISGRALVALRFYGSPGPQGSLKVTVRSERGELASWRVDQGESFLFAQLMEPRRRHEPLRLEVTRERVGHAAETSPGHLSICFAAAFPV